MAVYREEYVDIELMSGSVFRSFLNHTIGKGDQLENIYGVKLYRNKAAVDLSGGSCQAIFMAPDGSNILVSGTYAHVSGNKAWVQLPQACYNVEGQFTLAIKVIKDGVTGTMRIIDGVVANTGVTGAVAPTGAVPTYQEILALYEQMQDAVAAANSAIAGNFDATKDYPEWANVINEGTLYVLPFGHTAGTLWTDTKKYAIPIGDQATKFMTAFNGSPFTLAPYHQALFDLNVINEDYRLIAITNDGNGNFYLCGGSNDKDGTSLIVKVANIEKNDLTAYGNVTSNIINAGSACDITYDSGSEALVICCGTANHDTAEETLNQSVVYVDPSTLEITDTKAVGKSFIGLEYWGGKFYARDSTYLYVCNSSFSTITTKANVEKWRVAQWLCLSEDDFVLGSLCADPKGGIYLANSIKNGNVSGTAIWTTGFLMRIDIDTGKPVDLISFDLNYPEQNRSATFNGGRVYSLAENTKTLYYNVRTFMWKATGRNRTQLVSGDDLDKCLMPGEYFSNSMANSQALQHTPTYHAGFTMDVRQIGGMNVRQIAMPNNNLPIFLVRTKLNASSGFDRWRLLKPQNELDIMSYNVGFYHNGSGGPGFPADIYDEKVGNFKQMLMTYGPDIVGLQEDRQYLDEAQTIPASAGLFDPIWNQRNGQERETTRAKFGVMESELKYFSDTLGQQYGRTYRRIVYDYYTVRILFISAHPMYGKGDDYIGARLAEYQELFTDINNSVWDYCIVVGDFNTNSDTDRQNLTNQCSNNGFKMALGTYMPWIPTWVGPVGNPDPNPEPLDNILISGNMDFVKVQVLNDWYNRLYSDHLPIVARVRF